MSAKVTGVEQFVTALRLLNKETQQRVKAVVKQDTDEVAAEAAKRVPVSGPASRKAKNRPGPGELRDTIRTGFVDDGFTGFARAGYGNLKRKSRATTAKGKARARRRTADTTDRGVYAMVVEYGDAARNKPPRPFMRPAAQIVRQKHRDRLNAALVGAANAAARGGSAGGTDA